MGLERTDVLVAVAFGAAVSLIMTLVAGFLADKIGRKRTYQLGFIILAISLFPVFALVNSGSLALLYLAFGLFSIGLGLTYGPQAALYSELFPASVRFSAVSLIRDRAGIDLSFRNQAEQEVGALIFDQRKVNEVKETQQV